MPENSENPVLHRLTQARVAVIGDIMLDVYLWGGVSRISPEAPVPIIDVKRRSCCPGGAANVMRNISTLRAHAEAFGIIGCDEAGRELLRHLEEYRVGTGGILRSRKRRTTEKCRVIAGAQQLLRADFEERLPIPRSAQAAMVRQVTALIRDHAIDAVIFDDYAKGVLSSAMLSSIIAEAEKAGVITMLDPKPKAGGVTPTPGLTLLKPNRSEAFALAGMSDPGPAESPEADKPLHEAAEKIFSLWKPKNLLISLAGQGMILFPAAGKITVIPTRAREVFDVSGAGDTVAAVCTLALATGSSPLEAAELANRAAGIVVGKIGTAPIQYEELAEELQMEQSAAPHHQHNQGK